MTVYQALGEEYVEGKILDLTSTGKSMDEARDVIRKEAREKQAPLKKGLSPKVYAGFVADGYTADDISDYMVYEKAKKAKKLKAEEEKKYAADVATAKAGFKEDYSGTGFKDRLDRGVGRTLTEVNVLAHKAVGAKPSAQRLGFLQADDEIAGEFEKANRTAEQQKIYEQKEKAYDKAEGVVDTTTTLFDMLWQKLKNPAEYDMAGLVGGEVVNPANLVAPGAGSLATKALTKTALGTTGKLAAASVAGAAADVTAGATYDYQLAKAKGESDEQAKKAALSSVVMNVAMGGAGGFVGGGSRLLTKVKEPEVKAEITDATRGAIENKKEIELPADLEDSSLLSNAEENTPQVKAEGIEGQAPLALAEGEVFGAGEKPVVTPPQATDMSKSTVVTDIVSRAVGREGTPYVWGGTNIEKGADCSGFIQSLHGEKGIALPRTAWGQAKSDKGTSVAFENMEVGDVIYFKPSATGKKYAPVTHTGLVTGFDKNGTPIMTHAKGKNFGVVTEVLSDKYKGRFYSAKRYVNAGDDDVVDARNTYDRYEDLVNDVEADVELLRNEREEGPIEPKDLDVKTEPLDEMDAADLGKIEKASEDTQARAVNVEEIEATVTDPVEREQAYVSRAPASVEEHTVSAIINDGTPVTHRMAGEELINKLGKTIAGSQESSANVRIKLRREGVQGVNLEKAVEAYERRDINIYVDFAAQKIRAGAKKRKVNDDIGRSRSEDTTREDVRSSNNARSDTETDQTNTRPKDLPEDGTIYRADSEYSEPNVGDDSISNRVPKLDERVDGLAATRMDVTNNSRVGENPVVPGETRVLSEEIESPVAKYERLKDSYETSNTEKAELRQRAEEYKIKETSVSDGIVKKYDTGFELKSYPKRVKNIDILLNTKEPRKITHTLEYAEDVDIKEALNFAPDDVVKRVINNSDVKHTMNKHGDTKREVSRGQIAVTKDDIANYPEIASTADIVAIVHEKNKKRVLSGKQINGHYVVVEEVSNKKNTLTLKTMWKVKGELKVEDLKTDGGKSPTLIVRNALGYEPNELMPLPDKSIAKTSEDVKTQATTEDFDVLFAEMDESIRGLEDLAILAKETTDAVNLDRRDVLKEEGQLNKEEAKILMHIEDPLNRHDVRKQIEREKLSGEELASWERVHLDRDGNMKKVGEC